MAKMFYTLEEAAQKLGTTATEVRDMAASGRLQEFRDRDRLMFKVEQVDLLAGHGDEDEMIPLSESAGSGLEIGLDDSSPAASGAGRVALGASGSGSGIPLEESPKERSGISIFDADQLEEADPSAVTQVTAPTIALGGEQSVEAMGSGSGLLDLTREGDDTSLGADLLEGVYSEGSGAFPAAAADTGASSGLFEPSGAASDVSGGFGAAAMAGTLVAVEPYDPAWSGITGGVAVGMIAVLALALTVTLLGIIGAPIAGIVGMLPENVMIWGGIFGGAILLLALIGWALGRRA